MMKRNHILLLGAALLAVGLAWAFRPSTARGQSEPALLQVAMEPLVVNAGDEVTAVIKNLSWTDMAVVTVTAVSDSGERVELYTADNLLAVGPRRRANVAFTPPAHEFWRLQVNGSWLNGSSVSAQIWFPVATTGASTGEVAIGQTVQGNMGSLMNEDEFGYIVSAWAFQAQVDSSIMIELEANSNDGQESFWHIAYLVDRWGEFLTADPEFIAPITLTEDSPYYILVVSNLPNSSYRLTVKDGTELTGEGGALVFGQTVNGLLNEPAAQHSWTFTAEAGAVAILNIRSPGNSSLRGQMSLYDPQGNLLQTGADRIVYAAPISGEYRLVVQPLGNTSGAYRLALTPGGLADTGQMIVLNQSITGNLSANSVDVWLFEGRAGQTVVITADAVSAGFDPFIILYGPNGAEIGQDDDGGEGLNSRLAITLPVTGLYSLVVRDYGGGGGRYTVRISDR